MQLVVAATNQNGLYKQHMFCRHDFDSTNKFVRLAATLPIIVSSQFSGHSNEMKTSRRLAENDIITIGVTVKIQQVAVRGNYENPSNV